MALGLGGAFFARLGVGGKAAAKQAAKKAAEETTKKAATETAEEVAKQGLMRRGWEAAKPDKWDAISAGAGAATAMTEGGDFGDVASGALQGYGASKMLGGAGNAIKKGWQNKGQAWNKVSNYARTPGAIKGDLAKLGLGAASLVVNPYAWGTAIAADAAHSLYSDAPMATTGALKALGGGAQALAGKAISNEDWQRSGNDLFERGIEAIKDKSNTLFGTEFTTPLKDIEEHNKIFEATKKGLLDEKGNLPKNLQKRTVKAEDIANMKSAKETAEEKKQQEQATNHHDKMPVPQVNTLTPEQVAQVTNGSDNVGKWRPGPDGSGVIKRSDGTYAHVRPYTQEEQAARDRQYNDHINDQVNQYMLDYLSKAGSSLYSPRERAIYADLALGLRSVMGGGAGGSGAGSASGLQAMKFAAAQDAQAQKNLSDSLTREEARIEKDNKENPVLRDKALMNLKTNNGLRSVNPLDAVAIREAEAGGQLDEMINKAIYEQTGDPSLDRRDAYFATPGWAHPINQVSSWFTSEPYIKPRPVINTGGFFEPKTIDMSNLLKEGRAKLIADSMLASGYSLKQVEEMLHTGKMPYEK